MGSFLAMVANRTDFLFIGKLIGEVGLGFYTVAFRIPELMIMSIIYITSRVIFPAYAKLQHDQQVLQRAFLMTLQFVSLFIFPLGVGLFIVAPDFIHVVYTDKWAPTIPVLQILALFSLVKMVGMAGTDSIYKAIGRPDILTKIDLLKALLLFPVTWWAVSQYGIIGAALAQLGAAILTSGLGLFLIHQMLHLRLSNILGEMRIAFLSSMLMLASVKIFLLLASTMPSLPRLIIASSLGALVYMLTIWILSRETVLLVRKLIGSVP
jgi:O-antigen/teichoic acid export membrane protein